MWFLLTPSIQAAQPSPPKAILDFFGFKYLRDPFYHSENQAQGSPAGPPAEFIKQVFEQVPPPTAAPPPFGPNGPDLSTARGAYLVTSVRNGVQFDDIIAEDEYDQIDPESLFKKSGFPPTFLVQGTADVVVHAKFAQQAYSRLQQSGVPSELRLVEGAAHGFDAKINRESPLFKFVQEGVDFLAEHLKD
jgi:acetyl esterase/lipase